MTIGQVVFGAAAVYLTAFAFLWIIAFAAFGLSMTQPDWQRAWMREYPRRRDRIAGRLVVYLTFAFVVAVCVAAFGSKVQA